MEIFMSFVMAFLGIIYLIGLIVTLCFRRWGIHDLTEWRKP